MSAFSSTMLGLTMVAAGLLLIVGVRQAISPHTRKRGLLMIVCGLVFVGNVMILTL